MGGTIPNTAPIFVADRTVELQYVPLHAPLNPRKVDPAAGVAARYRLLPDCAWNEQVLLQVPDGNVTVPEPGPRVLTVTV